MELPIDFGVYNRAAYALIFSAFQGLIALVFGLALGRRLKSRADRWIIVWLIYNGIVHLTLEAAFVYYSIGTTVAKSSGPLAEIWKEYGLADSRWAHADITVVTLEVLTVVFCGPLCPVLIYAILKDKPYRHYLQIVLCVCELYGGWMTFGPEWLTGSPNLDTSKPLFLWVYLVFFNMLWAVMDVLLLVQSWLETATGKHDKKKKRS